MAQKAQRNGLLFRPHFKTHQSLAIAEWFREAGVEKITVSSLDMATYFASGGWKDITIAIPVNILEIEAINVLAAKITLNLVLESMESLAFLAVELKHSVNVFIKTDLGYQRTGVAAENTALLEELIAAMEKTSFLQFKGLLAHAGNSYDARGRAGIKKVYDSSIEKVAILKNHFSASYPEMIISLGDTPTCSYAENFPRVDEIRPGNFVFYDLTQVEIGACQMEDIAVALACPIIAIHQDRKELIIYGGGVHFSKDRVQDSEGKTIWGRVVADAGNAWGDPIEQVYLKKLSQEHGTVSAPDAFIQQAHIGDILKILPVHSCMSVDCMPDYLNVNTAERVTKL